MKRTSWSEQVSRVKRLRKYVFLLEECLRLTFEDDPDFPKPKKRQIKRMRLNLRNKGDLI